MRGVPVDVIDKVLNGDEDGYGIRVHPDDEEKMMVLLSAAQALLAGPLVEVAMETETLQRIQIVPEEDKGEYRKVDAGLYRMVMLDTDPLSRFPEEIERPDFVEPEEWAEERQRIRKVLAEHWDFSWKLPLPNKKYHCLCGAVNWQIRYWLFHDYGKTTGDPKIHKFRHRCDISMKCKECGYLGLWGVVVPPEWWEEREISPALVSWRAVHDVPDWVAKFHSDEEIPDAI